MITNLEIKVQMIEIVTLPISLPHTCNAVMHCLNSFNFLTLYSCFWFNLEVVKINPGSIFAIYSKEIHSEGLWYRVKALKVKGDKVQIEYMDYGDTAMVSSSSLKNIPPRFLELPFQVCDLRSFLLSSLK